MYDFDEIRKRFPSAQGLSENQIVERLAQNSGVPYEQVAAQFGITKDTSSGFFGGAQDVVIEAANAAAGLVGSASEFVSPGNRLSRGIRENIIEPGEARQTVPTQLAKRNLSRGLETSEFGPQARAVYDYVTENPLLALGQAAGGFAPVGLPIRGAQAAATGLGLGTRGAARTGLATGSVVSGAAAGGEAGGSAYELVMNTPREVLLAHPQAQALIESGVTDEAAIYEELATRAARRASIVPAALGAVAGAVGAESALVSPVRGARGVAKKTLTEFGTEGLEEGTTTYAGRAAAQEYNPAIDPMAGVAGSALLGGVMGAGIAAPIALARMERDPTAEKDLTQPDTAPAQEAPVGEEAPASPILTAARTLADFDPYAEIEARAAAGRPMSEAEATQFLSSTLAAQRAGQQFMDLMQRQQESAVRAGEVGEQYQRMIGQRGDQILRAQDAGEAARPVVAGLEQDLTAQEAPFIAAQQAGAGTQQLPGMVAGAGTVADYRRIMNPDVMQPVETQEFQPVERTALLPQQPAPFSNIRMDRPGPAPTPAPSSLLSERPADVEPVTPVGAPTAVAAALPAAQPAAGVSSIATTGAPSGTQASQAKQTEAQGQKPAAVRIASTQTAEQQAADELGLTQTLQVANRAKQTGDPLQASVEGAGKVAVSGKTSLNVKSLRDIRDALLNPSATVEGIGAKEQRIADAVRAFAKAYYKFSNAGGNMLRGIPSERAVKGEGGETIYKPTKFAGQTPAQQRGQIKAKTGIRVENTTKLLEETRAALAALGKAVNGNAKDVEAIVKLTKDMVQQKLHTQVNDTGINEDFGQKTTEREDGKDPTDIAFGKLDTMLSQGWNAAKANMFQGTSDAMFVRQTAIRESKEATAAGKAQTPLEKAAEGYAVFGKGESSDGILGVMNYIQTHGTPFERTIAKAVFESMAYQEAPKLVFITEGNPRFDPKKNTIYIQRDASAAVTLHEALHSALQWYVYKNPDAPEVRALKASLKQVVNFKGPLNADAKRVQDLLKALMKDKKELDAVLELVSYGNTLNDFRRALEAMDSKETPKSFFDAASNVWQTILTAVQKMLGVKPSVASDVIANTFKLLEAAGQKGQKKEKAKGNILEAAIDTTTSAFKRWFGDSKVVDKSGNPLVVYHGTDKDFKEFDLNRSGSGSGQYLGKGFYFAQSAGVADAFAGEDSARVMPVYLSIKNPFRTASTDLTSAQKQALRADPKLGQHFKAAEAEGDGFSGWYTIQRAAVLSKDRANFIKSALELSGFDGIISGDLNEQPGMQSEVEIVAFRPEQIKSATGNKGTYDPASGNILEAAIQSGNTPVVPGTALPRTQADAITGQFQNPVSEAQLKKLSKTLLPEQVSFKFLFDTLGWASVPGKLEGATTKISDYVQKNHPGASTVASWVNSTFGLQSGVKDALVQAKDDKRSGSLIYNQIAQYFTDLPPQQSVAVLEYMDAKLANLRKQGAAPTFPINDPQMKDLADATITKWWEYARALRDPKQRNAYAGLEQSDGRWTGGVEFSQGLAFAESVDQLASPSFGVRNISKLISTRTKDEVTEDAITFRTDANGDALLTDKFVGMFLLTPSLKKRLDNAGSTAEASQILAELKPDEFISADLLTQDGKPRQNAEGVQLIPDRNYLWDLAEKDKGGFRFTARLDAKQALLTKKGRDLGHALQNTMAILANSYSANRLTEALASYEAGTPNATAFNTLDDLNAMLNGEYKGDKYVLNKDEKSWTKRVKQNQIVKLTDDEAKSERVKGLYRNRNQWVQLPNSPTYGALAGKIVNGSVWSAIEDMSDRRPLVNSAVYNGTMRWFKKAKTVYNPATWGTNVASNFTMAMMDDIPLPTLGYATKLYVGYMLPPAMAAKLGISLTREQQQLMLEIMKTNALLGDFSSSELKQSIYDSMRSTIGDKEQGVAERIMQFAKMEKDRIEAIKKYAGKGADAAERTDQLLGDWYAMQDNVFRVASMLNNLGQQAQAGKTIDAEAYRLAGDHARFAFLDYDIDSKAVRIMRQTAFPFISWPYAAAKMIGNVAVHKPWKLVNLYAGLWILDGLTQAITGDDDDELRESGPEWARSRMLFGLGPHTHVRVPFMGDSENPVYYDIGKYITPSAFGDRVPNAFLGLSWWPSFVSPGGPFISSALAVVGGIDPYNGRPLSPPSDSDWEKLSDRLVYTQSLFAPNLPFLNARELEKAKEAFAATEGRSENYSSLYLARTAGMRFYDFNVQGSLDQQDRAAQAVEREYKTEIGKLKRKQERLENPDWDAFYEREEELMMRMEKRIAEIRGGKTGEE
jgi:hypothetical protein